MAWQGTAKWGSQVLSFAIYTGLARLLDPRAFGLVAIAGVYVAFVQVFVNQGFGMAIIQRRHLEREHLDSAFWISAVTSCAFCLLSLALAGVIANLFKEPRVAPVIRCLSLSFPLGALGAVPSAILTRELDFRPLAAYSLGATVLAGAVGLSMAFFGWGVWSIVGQQLVGAALACVGLWMAVPWRPSFRISTRHLRDLYGFSLSITGNDVLWFFVQKSDQTMVGYGFGAGGLGPYSLASRLVNLLHDGIVGPLQTVAFPAFSELQSDSQRFERALHQFCELSSFVSFPVFAGAMVVAPEVVPLVFGARWVSAVPILQALCLYGIARSAFAFIHPVMLAKGRTGPYLVMFIVQAGVALAGCLVALRWSPRAVAVSVAMTMTLTGLCWLGLVTIKVLGISPATLLRTFIFPASSTVLMAIMVYFLRGLVSHALPPAATLAACVTSGAFLYVLFAALARPDLIGTIWGMMGSVFSSDSASVPKRLQDPEPCAVTMDSRPPNF